MCMPCLDRETGIARPPLLSLALIAEGEPVSVRGRVRRAWWALREPLPADEQAVVALRVRQRYGRWLRWRRVLHRRMRWIDPGKPPISVLRWLAVLGIALAWWANGSATSPLKAWLPYAIIGGVLILPDVAGFAVGASWSICAELKKRSPGCART